MWHLRCWIVVVESLLLNLSSGTFVVELFAVESLLWNLCCDNLCCGICVVGSFVFESFVAG